ncbi:hypothetical protein AEAC466_17345 [Asticcacaulis sp. AC466]|uniref:DUF2190 family protein n=1 Tax=Asticcacaulis sp. AC466 TaxID=1282362 RepID=UPI0003C3D5A1|nr:DUF2190 family protein [Asticcacaulis sp. AC466]ESQ82388.1 hypothetical protein AEAC466_17345 [Asticcacaulis sp. AC466]
MAKNEISAGHRIDCVAPSGGVVSGLMYKIGSLIGIALTTAAVGDIFTLHRSGEHDVKAEGSASGQAWAVGDTLYWDDTAKQVTKTASSNTKCGIATSAKSTTLTTGRMVLVTSI